MKERANLNSDKNDPTKTLFGVATFFCCCWAISANGAFVKQHPALITGLIAVCGQVYIDWHEVKGDYRKWKRLSMAVLILSLLYQLHEAAEVDRHAAEANERAGNAEKEAQQFRLEADRLEEAIQPRRLKFEQRAEMVKRMMAYRGKRGHVVIRVNRPDLEPRLYAQDLASILSTWWSNDVKAYDAMDTTPLTGIDMACDNPPQAGAIELFNILLATKVLPSDAKLQLEKGLNEVRIDIWEKPSPKMPLQ